MWILAVALVLVLAAPPGVEAQGAARTYRVGFVGPYSPGLDWSILQGYQERLRELGWVEGQNIVTTYRWADGDFSRLPGLVDSIMSAPPDLLVLPCGPAIKTARDLSPAIPIVARCIDLKDFGREIDTVARPGGFTTGVTYFSPGATRRRLELLKELVPNLSRVGVLYQPESSWMRSRRRRGPPASASSVWNGNPPRIPAARSTSRSSDAWAR
jgi:putative tryptophan/tyrosine transport system substrate-binding protein